MGGGKIGLETMFARLPLINKVASPTFQMLETLLLSRLGQVISEGPARKLG